jgi:hypothetical protein
LSQLIRCYSMVSLISFPSHFSFFLPLGSLFHSLL